jgi:O-antigen biosynthesis rhamnosyltransferase
LLVREKQPRVRQHHGGMSMKVLHFYKTYLPEVHGGAQQVIYEICEGTRRYGVDCEVLALSSQESETKVVGRHRAHFERRAAKVASTDLSVSAVGRFRALAANADVVHYHYPWPMMDLAHFLVLHGKPSVVTYHSDIVRQRFLYRLYQPIMHRFLSSSDVIVATSPSYVRTSPVLRRYRDKVRVIPIGIDDAPLRNPDPALLERWRAKVGTGFFLFIGVARYYKRLDVLLAAARGTEMPVVIAGASRDDAQAHRSRDETRSGNIVYTGAISDADKAALLHLCRAVVLPSSLRSEAFGIVLLEGAMLGKPLICCELGTGTTYVNIDGLTGFAVPPGDAGALRSAMRRLHGNADLARRLGHNARKRYLEMFTADRMARAYAGIYEEVSGIPMQLTPSGMARQAPMRAG